MKSERSERFDRLKNLSPLQAIQTLLGEGCGRGEERYLVAAILRDRRIELDDDEISYVIHDARQHGIDAPAVFDRLLTVGDGVQSRNMRPMTAR